MAPEHYVVALSWCCYAGMGAVCHWAADWETLKEKGIYETLISPRGIEEMDEYVMSLLRISMGSVEEKRLTKHLLNLATICLDEIKKYGNDALLSNCQSMYKYGMLYNKKHSFLQIKNG